MILTLLNHMQAVVFPSLAEAVAMRRAAMIKSVYMFGRCQKKDYSCGERQGRNVSGSLKRDSLQKWNGTTKLKETSGARNFDFKEGLIHKCNNILAVNSH